MERSTFPPHVTHSNLIDWSLD